MRDKILIFYVVAVFVGLLTGLIGSMLQWAIVQLNFGVGLLILTAHYKGLYDGLLSGVITLLMAGIAWILVVKYASEASGSGVQEIEGTLAHERPIYWRRLIPVKFFASVLAISSKMILGREGPTIQIGGNLGEMLGEGLNISRNRRDILIAAGAAAGLATAFNAPLAGVLFVLEEMRSKFKFSFTNFTAVGIACVSATIVLHQIIGPQAAIRMNVFQPPDLTSLWLFFLFGILIGFVGLLFNVVLMKTLYTVDKLSFKMRFAYVLGVGFLVGLLFVYYPEAVGGGYYIIEEALSINPAFQPLMIVLIVRFVMTMLCYSTGVPGGIFAPMLALGTLLGLGSFHLFNAVLPDMTVHPGMFAVAGMGALFSAAVRAPVTGIILVVEMTQNYSLILPLMVSCLSATTVVQLAKNPPIYSQLLRRTLKKSQPFEKPSDF